MDLGHGDLRADMERADIAGGKKKVPGLRKLRKLAAVYIALSLFFLWVGCRLARGLPECSATSFRNFRKRNLRLIGFVLHPPQDG